MEDYNKENTIPGVEKIEKTEAEIAALQTAVEKLYDQYAQPLLNDLESLQLQRAVPDTESDPGMYTPEQNAERESNDVAEMIQRLNEWKDTPVPEGKEEKLSFLLSKVEVLLMLSEEVDSAENELLSDLDNTAASILNELQLSVRGEID